MSSAKAESTIASSSGESFATKKNTANASAASVINAKIFSIFRLHCIFYRYLYISVVMSTIGSELSHSGFQKSEFFAFES